MAAVSVRLVPMAQAEFDAWLEPRVAEYAADHERSDGVSPDEALAGARQEFGLLLAQGRETPDMHLFTAVDASSGQAVGSLWLGVRGSVGRRQAFIYDIRVHAGSRGLGYGRALLAAAEAEARRLGLVRISLHVFGHNAVAIRLYETSGYGVTNLLMAKALDPA